MSGTAPAKVSPLTDMQKSDKYQQALSLNLDCGSDTLRKLIEKKLSDKNTSLKKHVHDQAVQTKLSQLNLFKEQKQLLNGKNPDLLTMDISLLTLVLLELFSLDMTQEDAVKRLRKCRNTLAHSPRSQLEDDQVFNEASQHIIGLSKDTTPEFEKEIKLQIKELKERKLVRTHSMLDIVRLLNESFMVKLMDKGDVDNADVENEIWIKYCLTKFVRLLARSYEMDILLQKLKDVGVITATTKRTIEHTHHAEKQFQQLVVFMVDETRENLLKFCCVMREMNSDIADFVIHNDGSRDIGKILKDCEKEKVEAILKSLLVVEKKGSVSCEDLHTLINERRRCFTSFDTVLECIKELFPFVNSDDRDTQFCGIKWTEDVDDFDALVTPDAKEEILTDMPCDRFAKYLATEMTKVKSNIGPHIEAIVDEEHSIHSSLFATFKPEEMETYFKPGLEKAGMRYNLGVKNGLINVQKKIYMQLRRTSQDKTDCLREFDKPGTLVTYAKCDVRPSVGNLLVATHEFIQPIVKKNMTVTLTDMVKRILRFAVACLNGKQNGTIHFGIKETENRGGRIEGLPSDTFSDVDRLNELLTHCLKSCLNKEDITCMQRCLRPVQIIPVEDKAVVLEVDVVPYSFYVKEDAIRIRFPQNGYQRTKCYTFVNNTITSVDGTLVAPTVKDLYLQRKLMEAEVMTTEGENALEMKQIKRLERLLLRGNVYVTDYFYPIICCGEISGSENEETIRQQLSEMSVAFTSAEGVFDFDSSVDLREQIENGEDEFAVKTPDEFMGSRYRRESGTSKEKIWMYANGNTDLLQQKLKVKTWIGQRYTGVKNAIENISRSIPDDRGLVIFFVFQKTVGKDIMLEIARDCFINTFKDGCIVIAENDTAIQDWKDELTELMDKKELEQYFVVGLSWNDVCCVMKRAFRSNQDDVYQFPNKKGYVVEMTMKEKKELDFQTIDIIDGQMYEKYRLQEESMSNVDRRENRVSEEKRFYRGENVSFWNFYYEGQVGPREDYKKHKTEVQKRLKSQNEEFYETYTIEHHPGAGGTTLGRRLLWSFSQVRDNPELSYRCCIVNNVSETTAEEIYRFLYFKEEKEVRPKPVIALVDNGQEDSIGLLKARINSVVYKYGGADILFCLLLLVNRVPVSLAKRDKVLTHRLSKRERTWFEEKFLDLEQRVEDVNTLLAFNVMRHSFDHQYVKGITQDLMKEVNDKESVLLESLSLVTCFDRDHSVPESIFDSFMLGKTCGRNEVYLAELEDKGPVGLVDLKRMTKTRTEFQDTWNVTMTASLKLLIKRQAVNSESCHFTGISIISHALAEAILDYIMEVKKIGIEQIVDSLLRLVQQHKDAKDPMSVQFVKLVCSLFKTRQTQEGDTRLKFSDLVLHLEQPLNGENENDARKRVIEVMEKCFNITKDPMVGQQLARFFIHIRAFDQAENAIQRSLKLKQQSSYLLDTYGQVFKMQMPYILENRIAGEMDDKEAASVINLAFNAIEKFREAQEMTGSLDENNLGCFNMEVKTLLMLLEDFDKFQCFEDIENFRHFLTDETFDIQTSSFGNVSSLVPKLESLRLGHDVQQHAHNSLKKLEERVYMIKEQVVVVVTATKNVMLMKTRERYVRFYGSEDEIRLAFWYGLGLKPLMEAYNRERLKFKQRLRVAERNLQSNIQRGKEADLLIYLGYRIIELSELCSGCTADEYKRLTNYSSQLCYLQMSETKTRPYIEGYLYYVMLHWPLPDRLDQNLDGLHNPEALESVIKKWEEDFKKNHDIKTQDQLLANRPKTYFAIGHGSPGNDLVDYDRLRTQWRKEKKDEGRERKHVKADNAFQHRIFEETLARLSGVVETCGNKIRYKVDYRGGRTYFFHIHTYDNCSRLRNKAVTFVLGFSWMGPTAMDVRRSGKHQSIQNASNLSTEDAAVEDQETSRTVISLPAEIPESGVVKDKELKLKVKTENVEKSGEKSALKEKVNAASIFERDRRNNPGNTISSHSKDMKENKRHSNEKEEYKASEENPEKSKDYKAKKKEERSKKSCEDETQDSTSQIKEEIHVFDKSERTKDEKEKSSGRKEEKMNDGHARTKEEKDAHEIKRKEVKLERVKEKRIEKHEKETRKENKHECIKPKSFSPEEIPHDSQRDDSDRDAGSGTSNRISKRTRHHSPQASPMHSDERESGAVKDKELRLKEETEKVKKSGEKSASEKKVNAASNVERDRRNNPGNAIASHFRNMKEKERQSNEREGYKASDGNPEKSKDYKVSREEERAEKSREEKTQVSTSHIEEGKLDKSERTKEVKNGKSNERKEEKVKDGLAGTKEGKDTHEMKSKEGKIKMKLKRVKEEAKEKREKETRKEEKHECIKLKSFSPEVIPLDSHREDRGRDAGSGGASNSSSHKSHFHSPEASSKHSDDRDKRNLEALTEGAVGGLSVSDEIKSTALDKTKLPADTTIVLLEEESRHMFESLSATSQCIVCVFGETENNIRIVVIHVSPKSYIYYIDKDLVAKWHLDDLLTNKDVNIVFNNIRTASVSLMTEYEILIGGHIWDIQLMLDKCSLDTSETERLKECGFTQESIARWTEKDAEYCSKLAPGNVDMLIILDLVARAKQIRTVYDICKGNLDNDVRSSKLYEELRKEVFAAAHPSSMEEKVKQLKKRQKKKRQKLNKTKTQDEKQKVDDSEYAT